MLEDDPEAASSQAGNNVDEDRLQSARELVLRAYAAAKATGRQDWRTMTIAVLKNRLLDLTDRAFDEAEWGATSTRDFVESLAPMITLDQSTRPTSVVLNPGVDVADLEPGVASETARKRGDWRIRQDLWEAVLDCVSGSAYVWDGDRAVAVDPELVDAAGALLLPTVTGDELGGWREAFAADLSGSIDEETRPALEHWRQSPATSQMLPPRYRNRWYGVLKRHVRGRLDTWFAEHAVEPPGGWIQQTSVQRVEPGDDTEHLRNAVLRAVRVMTRGELEALAIPATAVARLLR